MLPSGESVEPKTPLSEILPGSNIMRLLSVSYNGISPQANSKSISHVGLRCKPLTRQGSVRFRALSLHRHKVLLGALANMAVIRCGQHFKGRTGGNTRGGIAVLVIVYGQTVGALMDSAQMGRLRLGYKSLLLFLFRVELPEVYFAKLDQQRGNQLPSHVLRIRMVYAMIRAEIVCIQNRIELSRQGARRACSRSIATDVKYTMARCVLIVKVRPCVLISC